MIDYKKIIADQTFRSADDAFNFFWDEITGLWTSQYIENFPKHGEITLQNFLGFSFLIDHVWTDEQALDMPETRVISFFGISNTNIDSSNRSRMKKGWGPTSLAFSEFGNNYDKGHFIAHGFGGPVDVNIFPQRRDVNRGWSEEGKRYRKMENYVAANPGTFVFSRPVYRDLSICPFELEYGYLDKYFELEFCSFPNR